MISLVRSATSAHLARLVQKPVVCTVGTIRHGSTATDENLSFEDFTQKYVSFFNNAEDLFEVQRGLNNCFSYDLVPAPQVCEAALRACRRVNDYPTAVRVFDGLKDKCPNAAQYKQYLDVLTPVREELGVNTSEELELYRP